MKTFVKLIDEKLLKYCPNKKVTPEATYVGAAYTEEMRRADGYKDLIRVLQPEPEEGYYFELSYKELERSITEVWTKKEIEHES